MAKLLRPCATIPIDLVAVAAWCIDFNQTMNLMGRSAPLRFVVAITHPLGPMASHSSLAMPIPETND
jgi:hypothetical protein